ncbi:pitrilysin family protein [Luteolibacter sp. LG18]|uniref:M16 family metallopeptidase n=1 Tax=Luteolibacter sp. LG18 TaxID=2819286 RepID=UPI002B317DE2|nr:peptidase M16 [Luteolibacter sp. LG18]
MTDARYSWQTLPGGPRLAVATLPQSECAAVSIYVPAGSRDESDLPAGLAHFVEHMVFKGTHRRTARELSLEIESAGGQINACTSEDNTVYEGRGEASLLPVLADVLADMVWHPTFPAGEIDLERDVIGEEITMYRESPSDHIGDLLSQALWSPHPLGHPISGSLESIAGIDRKTLAKFRDRHYFRNDIVISVAGPFSSQEALDAIVPHLPTAFGAPMPALKFDRALAQPRQLVETRDTEQLQLALAWHSAGRHDASRHAMRLLSLMLGETASSRLFLGLREERGLCYQIGSDVTLFDDTGAFEIVAGLDPESKDEALDCIRAEIADLVARGPRAGELDRAKRLAIGQSKMAFESTGAQASWAGECLLDFNRIPTPADWRADVSAVTEQDIHAAAKALFEGVEPCIAEIRPEE